MSKIVVISQIIRIALVLGIAPQVGLMLLLSFQSNMGDSSEHTARIFGIDIHTFISTEAHESEAAQLISAGLNPNFWLLVHQFIYQFTLYGLLFVLFTHYRNGNVFTTSSVSGIRKIGICIMVMPIINIIYPPLLIVVLKLTGLLEHGEINLGIGTDGLSAFISGAMIMVVGGVMAEASRLKNEQDFVI